MIDDIGAVFAAWREVAHLSEYTGLSIGALAVLALVVYLDPALLRLAIKLAIVVVLCFICLVHGEATGAADVRKQWAAADAAAEKAAQAHDAALEQTLEARYQPRLAELQRESDERKAQSDAYEKKLLVLMSTKSSTVRVCVLGAAARRLRVARQ